MEVGSVERIICANLKLQLLFNIAMRNGETADKSLLLFPLEDSPVLPFLLRPVCSSRTRSYNREGHWSDRESIKYAIFLSYFQNIMEDPLKSSNLRIFDMMADMIITRDSRQCRNHHFKMLKYRTSITLIINSIASKHHPSTFQQISRQYFILIKTLLYNQEKYIRNTKSGSTSTNSIKQTSVAQNSKPIQAQVTSVPFSASGMKQEKHQQILKGMLKLQGRNQLAMMKTKVSYFESNYASENEEEEDEIPVMRLTDLKIEENPEAPTRAHYSQYQHEQGTNMGVLEMRMRTQDAEMRRMRLQRQWHAMNIRHISLQILKEKESIKYCESSIKLLQLAVEMATDL